MLTNQVRTSLPLRDHANDLSAEVVQRRMLNGNEISVWSGESQELLDINGSECDRVVLGNVAVGVDGRLNRRSV